MRGVAALLLCTACSSPAAQADWTLRLDPTAPPPGRISPALLGQYDLSGALFKYDQVPGLADAMKQIGFSEWRVGVGRWELETLLLPTLTDATHSCATELAAVPPEASAPAGATDLDLIHARDWIDGAGNYSLGYFNSVLDVAKAFGAAPFVDIDSMPSALAANQTPSRVPLPPQDACEMTWTNKVSNVRPADPAAFAAAAAGLVQRTVEGAHPEAQYWEIWNEPELAYAWDPSFEPQGKLDNFFAMAVRALVVLDQYRKSSGRSSLRFGLGSFAYATTAKDVIQSFDANSFPVDFVSVHAYNNDPLAIVADIKTVTDVRATSVHLRNLELALTEWGSDLGMPPSSHTLDQSLLITTVLVLGAALGLDRSHHSIFYDFYPGLEYGLLDHTAKPKPLYWAYSLLHRLIGGGGDRLAPAGFEDGRLDGGMGAVLASRDAGGAVRALIVNRNAAARTVRVELQGAAATPKTVTVLDDPAQPPRPVAPSQVVTAPARSLVLLEL